MPTAKARDIGGILNKITHKSLAHCSETASDKDLISALEALQKLSSLLDSAYLHPSELSNV